MATFTRKKLAFIQLASSKGDIYDPPASTKGLVHNILLHNANTESETVVLYMHDGTNEYIIYQVTLAANATIQFEFAAEGLVVDALSKLTGYTTTASKVTCLVSGTEETE
jgi:hypothetical protein